MLGLGTGFAIVLLIASIKLKVEVDPKVEQIHEALPNLDCGACGFAGCASYAKAVLANPELIGKCAPGGPETSEKIAGVLSLQVSDSGPAKRPIVHCRAHTEDRTFYAEYQGIPSCTAVNALPNVQACKFGCLGFGDCVKSCNFDALHMVEGVPIVDYPKCTGCGACAKACPRDLVELIPFKIKRMLVVACSNKEPAKLVKQVCDVGCVGCSLCQRLFADHFQVKDNLAYLNYDNYTGEEDLNPLFKKCPAEALIFFGDTRPQGAKQLLKEQEAKQAAAAEAQKN